MNVHGALRSAREPVSFQNLRKCAALIEFSAIIFLTYRAYHHYVGGTHSPIPCIALSAAAFADGMRNALEGFFPRR